jgi:3-oxoacyl-[acyl-carrier protein] reductase
MSVQLKGQVAIVFGAAGGVGRATSVALAAAGAHVVSAGYRPERLIETGNAVRSLGVEGLEAGCDISSEPEVVATIGRALEKFGRLDVVVNSAVWLDPFARVTELRLDDWRKTIEVDLTGAFLVSKHALKAMEGRRSGRVLHISSALAGSGCAFRAAYSAAKAGLSDLVKTLAAEMAGTQIKINAIAPRGIAGEHNKEMRARMARASGRQPESDLAYARVRETMMQATEVATLALFLAGPAGARINGQSIVIGEPNSSGWTTRGP